MPNPDLDGFRRAVQLRDRCRDAAVAASHRLEVPMSPVQANVAFDAMVDLIREREARQLDVARELIGTVRAIAEAWRADYRDASHLVEEIATILLGSSSAPPPGECLGPNMDCGRPLPCPDHPAGTVTRPNRCDTCPGTCHSRLDCIGQPVRGPYGGVSAAVQVCGWCPKPTSPDPKSHPAGQLQHIAGGAE